MRTPGCTGERGEGLGGWQGSPVLPTAHGGQWVRGRVRGTAKDGSQADPED